MVHKPKTYTKNELRLLYNVSRSTWSQWLKEVITNDSDKKKKLLPPAMVKKIFERFGEP